MKKILFLAAVSTALIAVPAAVEAQAAPGILIVDTDTVMQTCTACRAAQAQLQSQQSAIETRRNSLATQFNTEQQALQAEAKALNGKPAGPALKAKEQSFQTRVNQADQEIQNSIDGLKSTAAHVQQQIGEKLIQVVEQIRAQRRAAVVFSKNSALASDPTLDVTNEALTALNQQLPSVSVTPLPQQTAPAQTGQSQGR
jgi:Skp family chaperone for outer membrane proteins